MTASSQVLTKKGTEEGFCSINSAIVKSSNFYVGRSADVGDIYICFSMDRLLENFKTPDFLPAKKTEYQCFLCEWRLGEDLGERLWSSQWADTLFYHHSAWVCLMSSMCLHVKCNPACFGLRCLFDLDGRNRAVKYTQTVAMVPQERMCLGLLCGFSAFHCLRCDFLVGIFLCLFQWNREDQVEHQCQAEGGHDVRGSWWGHQSLSKWSLSWWLLALPWDYLIQW